MSVSSYPWIKTYPNNLRWDMPIDLGTMVDVFDQTVQRHGQHCAIDFLGKTMNWYEIGQMADQFAYALHERGIKKGNKVGLFLPNCPYFLAAYYGILKLGATVVNYNPLYAERELAHQIEDSETELLITLDLEMLYSKAQQMLSQTRLKGLLICKFTDILPFPKDFLFSRFKSKQIAKIRKDKRIHWLHEHPYVPQAFKNAKIDPLNDLAVLQYTGGTTGVPKGAMLTHHNIYANTRQCLAHFPKSDKPETMLAVLPFFHVFSMTVCMNIAVMKGMKILTIPRFDCNETLKLIHKYKPQYMPAVPAIFNAINNHKNLKKFDLSSLEFCISGGAPLPVEVKKKFEEKTGCVVVEGYGLTESSPVVTVNPPAGENVAGSIGLPLPQTIVEIINPEDKTTPMPIGERGELCVRGPQVMKGYWNKPDATADVLRDGRLYTGDVAIMDERGYIFIVDRIKDMIITNGYNVYPRNVEEAIYQHPSVEECIVAGLPDQQRGEIVKAWVKLKDGRELSADDLKTFLQDKISKMEMPKRIEFRDSPLPKTMIGKLSRKDVLKQELEKTS